MNKEVKVFLSKVTTPSAFYEHFKNKKIKNIRTKEALVYSAIYAEDKKSKEILKNFIDELRKEDLDIGWVKDVLQNVTTLKVLLEKDNDLRVLFNKNIDLTKSRLKL